MKNIDLAKNPGIKLLGSNKDIDYKYKDKTLRISPPCLSSDKESAAYVFEILELNK